MDKRVFLWALAGWLLFGALGATAVLGEQAPPEAVATGFLVTAIFGLMVGGMLGMARRLKANQRELGRFLLTVIGGAVLLGSLVVGLGQHLEWPVWLSALGASLGAIGGLVLSQRQFRQPISSREALLLLSSMLILGFQSFGPLIVPILVVSALAIHHNMRKPPR